MQNRENVWMIKDLPAQNHFRCQHKRIFYNKNLNYTKIKDTVKIKLDKTIFILYLHKFNPIQNNAFV